MLFLNNLIIKHIFTKYLKWSWMFEWSTCLFQIFFGECSSVCFFGHDRQKRGNWVLPLPPNPPALCLSMGTTLLPGKRYRYLWSPAFVADQAVSRQQVRLRAEPVPGLTDRPITDEQKKWMDECRHHSHRQLKVMLVESSGQISTVPPRSS